MIEKEQEDLTWLFAYWLEPSLELRQYLWAHEEVDVTRAKVALKYLGKTRLIQILRYLVTDYWKNFCGWPDLLLSRQGQIRFVEVKSRKDSFSGDQKKWMVDNSKILNFDFEVAKVVRPNLQRRKQREKRNVQSNKCAT